jgi:hypothetical protein
MNKRNPIWPYLLVLGCLFALSIAAPRGWQHAGSENRSDELANQPAPVTTSPPAAPAPEIVRAVSSNDELVAPAAQQTSPDATLAETAPQPEEAAPPVGEPWRFETTADLKVRPDHPVTLQRRLDSPEGLWQFASDFPTDNDPTSGANPATDVAAATNPEQGVATTEETQPSNPAEIKTASPEAVTELPFPPLGLPVKVDATPPAPAKEQSVAPQPAPEQSTTPAPPASTASLDAVQPIAPPNDAAVSANPPLPPAPTGIQEPVQRIVPPNDASADPPLPPPPPAPPIGAAWPSADNLLQRLNKLSANEGCRDWIAAVVNQLDALNRLLPGDIAGAAESFKRLRELVTAGERLATKLSNRAAATELRSTMYALVRRLDLWDQVLVVRRNAPYDSTPNTLDFLCQLERYESTGLESDASRLVQLHDDLKSSIDPERRKLAHRFDIHYRNANARFAISASLLNRLVPEQRATSETVNETIMGAPVSGNSTTSTALSVQLIPDPQKWQFNLVAAGTIDSQTQTTHGPATFAHRNQAAYSVRKHVTVDPRGLHVEPAVAEVDNAGNLTGLRTTFDAIPILRAVVRNYAISEHDANMGRANWETRQRVADRATQRVDQEADPRIVKAEENFSHTLIEPLKRLSLDPTAMTMATTSTRLQLRSRLAGGDQLGANTARPEAPSDSLVSVQVHESAINNLLERLELAGRTFTLPELHRWLANKFGNKDAKIPDDLPEGVQITFAQYNPIRVHVDGDRMEVVLNIVDIHQGNRHWREFEVRAPYRPTIDGMHAAFVRDGAIELGGLYKGKPEVALRGIFSKVLSRERKLELVPERVVKDSRLAGLQVTQLAVEDGWIAVAIGPQRAVAKKPTGAVKW